jgi:glycosyltransferase involved in cell wall biosynthesis
VNRLIILTSEFPFGKGENFLMDEVKVYAKENLPVFIIPFKYIGDKRKLPDGINIFIPKHRSKSIWPFGLIQMIRHVWFWKELALFGPYLVYKQSRKSFLFFLKMALFTKDTLVQMNQEICLSNRDVIYSYWFSGLTGGAILFNENQSNKTPIVSRAHGGDVYLFRYKPPYLPFREFLWKGINHLAVVSKDGANYLRSLYPAYEKIIHTHYLGTSEPGFKSYPSNDGTFRIVSCAYLSPVKRISLLIDSLKLAATYGIKISWTHFGGGALFESLKKYAELQLKDSGQWFLLGDLPNEQVLNFYRTHPVDLFVSVSLSEGLPISMMEAMSVGIPILSTNVGGVSEMIEETMLIPVESSPEQIARSIVKYANKRVSTSCEERIQIWASFFKAEKNHKDFIDSIENIILH